MEYLLSFVLTIMRKAPNLTGFFLFRIELNAFKQWIVPKKQHVDQNFVTDKQSKLNKQI